MNYRVKARYIDVDLFTEDDLQRFFGKVDFDECWNWQAGKSSGYGAFTINGNSHPAHRISYFLANDIEQDCFKVIDHLCKNTMCVNPHHLELVERGTNTIRGNSASTRNRVKTSCIRGHSFDSSNTGIDSRGDRYCKACRSEHGVRWREQNRDKYKALYVISNAKAKSKRTSL